MADEKTPERASEVVEESIRSKEGERILKYIKEDAYVITLEIGGKQLASEELADKIEQLGIQGKSQIVFIIGGSIGLGKEVLKKSNYALSFSKMTFPHQLMRVISNRYIGVTVLSIENPIINNSAGILRILNHDCNEN